MHSWRTPKYGELSRHRHRCSTITGPPSLPPLSLNTYVRTPVHHATITLSCVLLTTKGARMLLQFPDRGGRYTENVHQKTEQGQTGIITGKLYNLRPCVVSTHRQSLKPVVILKPAVTTPHHHHCSIIVSHYTITAPLP